MASGNKTMNDIMKKFFAMDGINKKEFCKYLAIIPEEKDIKAFLEEINLKRHIELKVDDECKMVAEDLLNMLLQLVKEERDKFGKFFLSQVNDEDRNVLFECLNTTQIWKKGDNLNQNKRKHEDVEDKGSFIEDDKLEDTILENEEKAEDMIDDKSYDTFEDTEDSDQLENLDYNESLKGDNLEDIEDCGFNMEDNCSNIESKRYSTEEIDVEDNESYQEDISNYIYDKKYNKRDNFDDIGVNVPFNKNSNMKMKMKKDVYFESEDLIIKNVKISLSDEKDNPRKECESGFKSYNSLDKKLNQKQKFSSEAEDVKEIESNMDMDIKEGNMGMDIKEGNKRKNNDWDIYFDSEDLIIKNVKGFIPDRKYETSVKNYSKTMLSLDGKHKPSKETNFERSSPADVNYESSFKKLFEKLLFSNVKQETSKDSNFEKQFEPQKENASNCDICTVKEYHEHETPAYDNVGMKCLSCGYKATSHGGIKTHLEKEHNVYLPEFNSYMCNVCGKTLMTITGFKHHMMSHEGEKLFQCEDCDKSYIQKNNLKVHILRNHSTNLDSKKKQVQSNFS